MTQDSISFLTPYWCGREMMKVHLRSIRRFYPTAPILVSKKGGELEEMESHKAEFGIRYWIEECHLDDAILRLFERCETDYICLADHDVVLLSSLDHLLQGLVDPRWDLVGIEERIRAPLAFDWLVPDYNGWFRFAPGYMDATFLMFDLRAFLRQWGLRGIWGKQPLGAWDNEFHYGICEKLKRHKYLLPFHTRKYGLANLLKDGDNPVLWHQWYGSHRKRFSEIEGVCTDFYAPPKARSTAEDQLAINEALTVIQRGENAFLADYPDLNLSDLTPAWGPDWDIAAERRAAAQASPGFIARSLLRVRRWRNYGLRELFARGRMRLERWWRLR